MCHTKIFLKPFCLGLALTGFTALGLTAARPASAQELTYTLSNIAFADGGMASGFFEFNPTTLTFGAYDITTTDGLTDNLIGSTYVTGSYSAQNFKNQIFFIQTGTPATTISSLILDTYVPVTAPGTFSLLPGSIDSDGNIVDSGELTPTNVGRAITAGSLIVTDTAPVPEASTTASLGLLLAFGLGSVIIVARRKKMNILTANIMD